MIDRDTIDSLGLDVTLEAEWHGEDEFLESCKVKVGNHLFEGSSVADTELSSKAFHISEDGVTHLFWLWVVVDDGDVVVEGEVYDNPFFEENDLKQASFGSGFNDTNPGLDGVQEASEGSEGVFLWMRMTNSAHGWNEYHLENIWVKVFEDGESDVGFERGYV
jgi:hypothetical protein